MKEAYRTKNYPSSQVDRPDGFLCPVTFPIEVNFLFGIVAIAENQVKFTYALFNPPLEEPKVCLLFYAGMVVVKMCFWEMDVANVFFGFVEVNWLKRRRRLRRKQVVIF